MTGTTMTIKYFDTLKYVQKARKIKDNNQLAEYQAHQMETALETVVQQIREETKHNFEEFEKKYDFKANNIATKFDIAELKKDMTDLELKLQKEISSVRYDMLKYLVRSGVSIVATLSGIMAHGFHWI